MRSESPAPEPTQPAGPRRVGLALPLLLLTACGGSGGGGETPPVTPSDAVLLWGSGTWGVSSWGATQPAHIETEPTNQPRHLQQQISR